jgi:hypothetical protein
VCLASYLWPASDKSCASEHTDLETDRLEGVNAGHGNAMFVANLFGRVAVPIVRVFIATFGGMRAMCAVHPARLHAKRCGVLAELFSAFA